MKKLFNKIILFITTFLICLLMSAGIRAAADEITAVSVKAIDYEMLFIKLDDGGNSLVYISTDKKNWDEIDAYKDSEGLLTMDISWASMSAETTLYFKGNLNTDIEEVKLPARNNSVKVIMDKATGELSFENFDDFLYFQWRKSTDYNWHTVSMDSSSAAYTELINKIENFRNRGIKLCFRGAAVAGTSAMDVGLRPSKEVTVSVAKRAGAPSISVNIKKMTVNTRETMEYCDNEADLWYDCDKSMSIEDLAADALYKNGGKTVTIKIRTAETDKKTYSKPATLIIKGQEAAPTLGDSTKEVTYYFNNGKLVLQFNKANKDTAYEYALVKADAKYDSTSVSWKTVKSNKLVNISLKKVPAGSKVYIRKKGIAGKVKYGEPTQLPTAEAIITIS